MTTKDLRGAPRFGDLVELRTACIFGEGEETVDGEKLDCQRRIQVMIDLD